MTKWKRALVTGASSGIGEAFARRLAAEGTAIVAVARRQDRLEQLPGDVEVLVADLTDPEDLGRVATRLAQGDIDLLVNNAGFGSTGSLAVIPEERVAAEVALDVTAVVRLTRAALPAMLERGSGAVLNVSSIVGFFPTPRMATYAGAKAFVTAFTQSVAEEVTGTGVRVAVLAPGLTRTEFEAVAHESQPRSMPAVFWQSADDVAAAGIAGLGSGKVVIVPGLHNKLVASTIGFVPRGVLRRVVGLAQRMRGA